MEPIIKLPTGRIKGCLREGVLQFHGIPYAKPPVGEMRFRLPEPPEPWEGIYDATYRRPVAPQGTSDLDLPMGPVTLPTSEDCLTLAVSTPSLEGRLPVAVWIHGGANCYCGGDLPWYDGASLARRGNLVEVNLNFRLGPLGFLCCPGVNEENLSIADQMLALRWVHENIARFGGDPHRVTLFGQSAGGNAIAHILSRPDSQGLFQQAVLESPSLGRGNHTRQDAFEVGTAVLREMGIDPEGADILRLAQEKPVEEILAAADRVQPILGAKHQGMLFKPVMDAWHTPEQTAAAAAAEAVRRGLRVMIGMTRDEIHAFVLERDPDTLTRLRQGQRQRYDRPGFWFAMAAARGGCPVWKYRFDWSAPESPFDACHCLELPFLFGNLDAWDAPMLKGASREEMERLRDTIQDFWCRFFRFEDLESGEWPRYTAQSPLLKCFDNQGNPLLTDPEALEAGK